jgi:2-aminoethylphosphonate-pyruvate transaminase
VPYAETADTARAWATARAIDVWVLVTGDLAEQELGDLAFGLHSAQLDGARVIQLRAENGYGGPEFDAADGVVDGELTGAPRGLFDAMALGGATDVRRLGVISGTRAVLEAAARIGAGAIVGIAPERSAARSALLAAQPDVIVAPAAFAGLDADRYASTRAHRERVLLNPGPAVVSDRVHRAVSGPDLCHREREYPDLFARVREKLLAVAGVGNDWTAVMIGGSGTAAMEAMTGAFVRRGRRLLVCRNGVYGDRLRQIAERLGIETAEVTAPDTVPIDPRAVERALDGDPLIDAVAIVQHETTTGLLNPVHEIGRIADTYGVLTLVDAISSLGAEVLTPAAHGLDVVAGTSNKCLHGLPGVSFLLLSPRAQERAADVAPRSLYLDVRGYLAAARRSTVPFTPPIPAMYGLSAALEELADEGLHARRGKYLARMAFLDNALERLGMEAIVAPPHRSASVRALPLPGGIGYGELHDRMRSAGYVIYGGLGEAAQTTFRVCALGAIEIDALRGFAATLGGLIAEPRAAAERRTMTPAGAGLA